MEYATLKKLVRCLSDGHRAQRRVTASALVRTTDRNGDKIYLAAESVAQRSLPSAQQSAASICDNDIHSIICKGLHSRTCCRLCHRRSHEYGCWQLDSTCPSHLRTVDAIFAVEAVFALLTSAVSSGDGTPESAEPFGDIISRFLSCAQYPSP